MSVSLARVTADDDRATSAAVLWRLTGVVMAIALATLLIAYAPTFRSLVGIWWRSETYMHGILVVPLSLYLVWRKRRELAALRPKPSFAGVGLLLGVLMLWIAAAFGNVLLVRQGAALAMIPALVWAVAGTRVVRTLCFPLAYLAFALPMGASLVPPLQDFTAVFVVAALNLFGVPVFVEGRYFSVPAGDFEVAEACSGVRYLIASLALGTLYSYLNYRDWRRRIAFVALSAVVPIVANGVRAFGIVMIASASEMRIAVGVDHVIYGWIFFGFVIFMLFWAGRFFEEPESAEQIAPREPSPAAADGRVATLAVSAVLCVAVLLAGPMLEAWSSSLATASDAPKRIVLIPPDGWTELQASKDWKPEFAGATADSFVAYAGPAGAAVDVFAAFYENQNQGAELINSENGTHDERVWHRVSERTATVRGAGADVNEVELRHLSERRVVWYWYQIGVDVVNHPTRAKWLEVRRRLRGDRPLSAVVALSARYTQSLDEARRTLEQFTELAFASRKADSGDVLMDLGVGLVRASAAEHSAR
jgi:exosortase A